MDDCIEENVASYYDVTENYKIHLHRKGRNKELQSGEIGKTN